MKNFQNIGVLFVIILLINLSNAEAAQYNPEVFHAQKKLKALGYNPGPNDGLWGKSTQKAIEAYQRDKGLPVTGLLDKQTKKYLGEGPSVAKSNYGFKNIPFGLSYDETYNRAKKIKIDNGEEVDDGTFWVSLKDKQSFSTHFKIGNRYSDVQFWFDHKERFYSFGLLATEADSKDSYDFYLREYFNLIYKLFKKKYGKPTGLGTGRFPSYFDIQKKGTELSYLWETNLIQATIQVYYIDSEHKFDVMARASDMEMDHEYRVHKQNLKKKEEDSFFKKLLMIFE